MFTGFSFLLAIAILVAVHEFGHFAMAVLLKVKVLKFSIGFGPRLLSWTAPKLGTTFALSAIPLGGYVRFLDERDGVVDASERHHAFNAKPLAARAAIVAAGPLANFLLAIVLYATVNWYGVEQPLPVLGAPTMGSIASTAGLRGGELVVSATLAGQDSVPIASFEEVRWMLTQAALNHQDISLEYTLAKDSRAREVQLPLAGLAAKEIDAELIRRIGIVAPWSEARIGDVMPSGRAESAGLRPQDLVLKVGEIGINDAAHLRELIRNSVRPDGRGIGAVWTVYREGFNQELYVEPQPEIVQGQTIGRVGAYIGSPPAMFTQRFGPLDGVQRALERTWEVSVLSLQMMGKIVIGQASLKNLSGPITIADYAGKSAALGALSFLTFLALISVSIGVLNLLPLPVLDGGHLMYYLWELVSGKPVSESRMEQLQKLGLVILLMMMSVAVFNDVTRLWG